MATYEEEVAYLKTISPESLPDNTAEAGLSAKQIKETFYAPLKYLHSLLEAARTAYEEGDETLQSSIDSIESSIETIESSITSIEETLEELDTIETTLTSLQSQITANDTDIETINTSITTLTTAISTLRSNIVNGSVIPYAAYRDGNGNLISTYYATATALASAVASITKIINGTTIVPKAAADQDGNTIDTTYVKIANIVDNVTSTTTEAPLSAYQGKVLKDALDTLSDYIYDDASNTSIDRLAEIFAFLTGHDDDETLDNVLAGKVSIEDLVTNLTTDSDVLALAASQGKELYDLIVSLTTTVDSKADADDVYDKTETYSSDEIDSKLFGAGFLTVSDYDEDTGEITFTYNSNVVSLSYDDSTGILTVNYV